MAVSIISIQPGVEITTNNQVVATAGVTPTVVTSAVLVNNSSAAITVWISVLRSGSSASVPLVSSRSIAANASQTLPELAGLVLSSGDKIVATGTNANIFINGFTTS